LFLFPAPGGKFHVSRILDKVDVREKCMPMSAIRSPAQEGSDLVMIAEEGYKKLTGSVLENKAQIAVAAALEKFAAQLADAEAAMHVRLSEPVYQIAKSEKAFHSLVLRQLTQTPDHPGIDREKSTQACSEALRRWWS
jgi:hypothetical protein